MTGILHSKRLGFLFWGIRWDNVIFFCGFPVMGALLQMPDLAFKTFFKILVFAFCNSLFLAQMFMYNDVNDAVVNPEEPKQRTLHALKHPELWNARQVFALCALFALASIVGAFAFSRWSGFLTLAALATGIVYSHPASSLKRHPALPELAHLVVAGSLFLSGWSIFQPLSREAWLLALFFGLVLAAGNFANQIEHFDEELGLGLRTTTIVFGKRPAFRFSLWLFFLTGCYLALLSLFKLVPGWMTWPALFLVAAWPGVAFFMRRVDWMGNIKPFRGLIRVVYTVFSLLLLFMLFAHKF
jgi:4-hydroxybenzoate polyprenyltransferase